MTGDEGAVAFLFVGGLSTVGPRLDLGLVSVHPNLFIWDSVLLTGLALGTGLT